MTAAEKFLGKTKAGLAAARRHLEIDDETSTHECEMCGVDSGALIRDCGRLVAMVEAAKEAIDNSIARADDHGDSYCSQPIRRVRAELDRMAKEEK